MLKNLVHYVSCHTHSQFSMLDGLARINDLVKKAKEYNMPAVALTDHGNMFGAYKFFKACQKEGIKPIIGCEVYVTNDPDGLTDNADKHRDNYHLILLAENDEGYNNLCRIVSSASENFYYKPRASKELLRKYSKGIIALTACVAGELPRAIMEKGIEGGRTVLNEYIDIFGKDNLYVEIQNHMLPDERKVYPAAIQLANELDLKIVATNDVHYINKEDSKAQEILLCISTKKTLGEEHMDMCPELYMKSPEEMSELFANEEEKYGVLSNTLEIAERCNVTIKEKQDLAPRFRAIPEGETESSYLRHLCEEALPKKYSGEKFQVAKKRMDYELGVIEKMGYSGYFLIVWDFIRYARNHNISIGPGRGSGAGSIVCYLTDITQLEPLELDLLFERFLNPERVSSPDIDTDIADYGRPDIAQYMMDTYGYDKSAKIVTFQTMAGKAAVKDVARVYGYPPVMGARISNFITEKTIKESLENNVEFADDYSKDPDVKKITDMAMMIEGLPRQKGSHAAGVVISKEPLKDVLPISLEEDGWRTEFDKEEVEKLGLLKMDLLGLINLSIIDDTQSFIKQKYGKTVDLTYGKLPMDDKRTMQMLCKGDTYGVFQLESSGMTKLVTGLAPKNYRDLVPLVALYRPGPLGTGMVEEFVECRHGRKQIKYIHPMLEPILKETYGVILYQEQVMKIVQVLGGFSLGEADLVRRAMGHKEQDVLNAQENKFVQGCVKNGIDEPTARKIFGMMRDFAKYGFNKSHSAAYAYIAYQTAYLKAHFPVEYLSAYMSHTADKKNKLKTARTVCSQYGIKFLPVDVNKSGRYFIPEDKNIRIGFNIINGVGESDSSIIINARKAGGSFTSVDDFMARMVTEENMISEAAFKKLTALGAFNGIYATPALLDKYASEIHKAVKSFVKAQAKANKKNQQNNSLSLFSEQDMESLKVKPPTLKEILPDDWDVPPITTKAMMETELENYGFYATVHPLDPFKKKYIDGVSLDIAQAMKMIQDGTWNYNWRCNLCAVKESVKLVATKKNDIMAFATFSSYTDSIDAVLFPQTLKKAQEKGLDTHKVFWLTNLRVESRNGNIQIIVDENGIVPLD